MKNINVVIALILGLSSVFIGGSACSNPTVILSTSAMPCGGGMVTPFGGTYQKGDIVTLVAVPAKYYIFSGWSGDISGFINPLTVEMNSNKNIVASFVKILYNLQTSVDSLGNGTIDPKSGSYDAGSTIKITAFAGAGYRFDHWGGSAIGTTNPIRVLMDSDKAVTAFFVQ